ncbi:hypothetical protein SAMN05421595_2735 [Austwickia chelonae]|nr:hypothetical protein SAMN05421595_2735 [Austwickia chelonae]
MFTEILQGSATRNSRQEKQRSPRQAANCFSAPTDTAHADPRLDDDVQTQEHVDATVGECAGS